MTALLIGDAPEGRHLPRRGRERRLPLPGLGRCKRMARRLDHRCAVSPDAVALAESGLGGTYELLFNGVEVERFADGPVAPHRRARRSSSSAATSPARASRCSSRRWPTCPPDVRALGGRRRPADRGAAGSATGHDRRIEWLGRISDDERSARMRGLHRVLLAVGAGRVLRDGAPRGHGRRAAPSWRPTSTATATSPATASTPSSPRSATRPPWPRPCAGCSTTTACGPSWWPAGGAGPSSSRWRTWPSATTRSTRRPRGLTRGREGASLGSGATYGQE